MIVKDLELILSMVPEYTPVLFEIEGVDGHAISGTVKYTHEFATERGDLSLVPEIESIIISVEYGPENIPE